MKILYASSEAAPFVKTGGLGDVAGSLPGTLNRRRGVKARVVLPLYSCIPKLFRDHMEYLTSFAVPLSWRQLHCGVFRTELEGVTYYFIDNEYYFARSAPYGYFDDGERFAFFSKAVLEMLPHIDYRPDILHCNDWQTALIPLFLGAHYSHLELYRPLRTVFTIHNLGYQGQFGPEILDNVLGVGGWAAQRLEMGQSANYMKSAIETADSVTTVSPTYAQEIQTPEGGHGLDSVLRGNAGKITGILNGIDMKEFDPAADRALFETYSVSEPRRKGVNKIELQKLLRLPMTADTPLIAMISRLVPQKGIDLVVHMLEDLMRLNLQLVVLGKGEGRYENLLRTYAARFPEKITVQVAFSEDLARKYYAGADMLLMPSLSEPCGLAQMIAMRYGTVPIVRATGGLRDTVLPYPEYEDRSNGFSFERFNAHDMLDTIRFATGIYTGKKQVWNRIVARSMAGDYGWDQPAAALCELYAGLLKKK
jgi:starch synthase